MHFREAYSSDFDLSGSAVATSHVNNNNNSSSNNNIRPSRSYERNSSSSQADMSKFNHL